MPRISSISRLCLRHSTFIPSYVLSAAALTVQTAARRLNPPSAELRVRRFTNKLRQTSNCILTTPPSIMNSFRIARAAVRARPAAIARPIQRRGYAEVASDKIKLSLALPHQVCTASTRQETRIAISWRKFCRVELTASCVVYLQVTGCVCLLRLRPIPQCEDTITDERLDIASRSISLPRPVIWVSWPTTFPQLSS
jgi:hypothetical protein